MADINLPRESETRARWGTFAWTAENAAHAEANKHAKKLVAGKVRLAKAYNRAILLAAFALFVVPVSAARSGERSYDPRYEGVNAFVDALSANDRAKALDLIVSFENGPRGHLEIPDPDVVLNSLLGCSHYGHNYASGDFPLAITRWRCADAHYSLWVRPSYDGQVGKVQIVQFGPYSNPQANVQPIENPKASNG